LALNVFRWQGKKGFPRKSLFSADIVSVSRLAAFDDDDDLVC